jgi:hypothetical protein
LEAEAYPRRSVPALTDVADHPAAWGSSAHPTDVDPEVRLQVEDSIYDLTATRVASQDEFDRFADAYEKKYGRRPGNENVTEAYLFRLW